MATMAGKALDKLVAAKLLDPTKLTQKHRDRVDKFTEAEAEALVSLSKRLAIGPEIAGALLLLIIEIF